MAGGRIKGITVEIGGDTTGLDKALKGVNSTIKTTQSSLKDVNNQPRHPEAEAPERCGQRHKGKAGSA